MKITEINEKLLAAFPDEIDGAVEYHTLALAAKEAGKEAEYVYLMKTAMDEMQHAEWIHEYLVENGIKIPEDQEKEYTDLKAAHKFR